jgi:hypothetical protein
MNTLCLQPALEWPRPAEQSPPLFLAAEKCVSSLRDVWLMEDGRLTSTTAGEISSSEQGRLLFSLTCLESSPGGQHLDREWLLVRRDRSLQVNGIPVLPVVTLEGGSLLAADRKRWLVTSVWKPAPRPAPPEVEDVDCPVCGAPLSAAPVVQCPCGLYMHLERPNQPDDTQALNCYLLAGSCGTCGRTSNLAPSLLPVPDETLVAAVDLEHTLSIVDAS